MIGIEIELATGIVLIVVSILGITIHCEATIRREAMLTRNLTERYLGLILDQLERLERLGQPKGKALPIPPAGNGKPLDPSKPPKFRTMDSAREWMERKAIEEAKVS